MLRWAEPRLRIGCSTTELPRPVENRGLIKTSTLWFAKILADCRINNIQQYFPSLIWYNSGPCSICFFFGSERLYARFVVVGISFWRISRSGSNSLC